MGDDDELGCLAQVFEDGQQSPEVRVIQGGLDLVHDVERAGARLEDRDEEGHGREGALAAAQQRQALDLLARGLHRHLDSGGEHVVGVGEVNAAGAAREQDREDLVEGRPGVLERGAEDVLHLLVDLVDDREQVLAGVGEVG